MHRSQTLSATRGAGCDLLAEDVAVTCARTMYASCAKRSIGKSRRAIRFLIKRRSSQFKEFLNQIPRRRKPDNSPVNPRAMSPLSLQGFTFLYGVFTCNWPPGRYHTCSGIYLESIHFAYLRERPPGEPVHATGPAWRTRSGCRAPFDWRVQPCAQQQRHEGFQSGNGAASHSGADRSIPAPDAKHGSRQKTGAESCPAC